MNLNVTHSYSDKIKVMVKRNSHSYTVLGYVRSKMKSTNGVGENKRIKIVGRVIGHNFECCKRLSYMKYYL